MLTLMLAVALAQIAAPAVADAPTLQALLDSINKGNGWAVAGVLVSFLTWALRNGALKRLPWPGAVKWLYDHPAVGFATPWVLSALGGILTTFASGTPFSWQTLAMSIVKVGSTAIATFVAAKTITESHDVAKEAAAAVDSKAAAIAELKAPPPTA